METESYLSEGPLPPFTIIAKSGASATASKQAAIEAAIDYLSFVGLVRRLSIDLLTVEHLASQLDHRMSDLYSFFGCH